MEFAFNRPLPSGLMTPRLREITGAVMLKKQRIPRNFYVALYLLRSTVFPLLFIVILTTGCTNFHEVTQGVLYRSRQLSGSQFDHFIKKFHIKTIINLGGHRRGKNGIRTKSE